jgi:hypothetical protein
MRITNISLYSSNYLGEYNEALTFSLRDVEPSAQYMVETIVGLDADEIIPKFYGFGLNGKTRFYDFGLKPKEIAMRIVLNPRFRIDESYSDVRDQLYRAISATRTGIVALHFLSGVTTVARIFGFITKFEVLYFSSSPEVQLTIRCDDPMFRAINPVSYAPSELKTTNPIIIPDSLSTAPHGFSGQVTFKAFSASFTIQEQANNPDWIFKVIPSGGFSSGDVLYFSSDYANKYLYMIRAGATTYLMDKLQPDSIWPLMFPGATMFHFVDIANFDWNKLEYYAAYWGV